MKIEVNHIFIEVKIQLNNALSIYNIVIHSNYKLKEVDIMMNTSKPINKFPGVTVLKKKTGLEYFKKI